MAFDVVVVGAGPAGLCLARSLAGSGLRIALVERQAELKGTELKGTEVIKSAGPG